jgi:hypothetical protein
MDFISEIAGFRHPAIDSVLSHVQNEEDHAQQLSDSAGKYPYFFPYRITDKDQVLELTEMK